MKNTYDISQIIDLQTHSGKIYKCIKFEVSTTNISEAIDINVEKEKKYEAK